VLKLNEMKFIAGFLVFALFFTGLPVPEWLNVPAALAAIGNVRLVQTGTVLNDNIVQNIRINPVNISKAFAICYNRTSSSNPSNRATCELVDSTTLMITTGAVNTTEFIEWQVVEFDSGVRVQRDVTQLEIGTATTTVTIGQVDLTKAFVLITESASSTDQVNDEDWLIRARLTDATTLQLGRNESDTMAVAVSWQVIEMDRASVQSNIVTMEGANSVTGSLSPSVNTDKTFIVYSRALDTGSGGVEGEYQARAELTNDSTVTFTRVGNNTSHILNIAWFAVEMTDDTRVQRGTTNVSVTTDVIADTAISGVNSGNTSVFLSASGGGAATANLDETSWSPVLTGSANLRLWRAGTGTAGDIAWFVVEWAKKFTRLRGTQLRLRGRQIRLLQSDLPLRHINAV